MVKLGRMTSWTHHHHHAAKPGLIALIRPLRPHCSRTFWCYPNLLKISSDIKSDFRNGFSDTLHADLTVESNFFDHYLQGCTKMHLMLRRGPAMRDGSPLSSQVGEYCAVGHGSMVKIATPPCSPYGIFPNATESLTWLKVPQLPAYPGAPLAPGNIQGNSNRYAYSLGYVASGWEHECV